jgi:hypothetical protein
MAAYPRSASRVRLAALDPPAPLVVWCATAGVTHAIVGGFFVRPGGRPLGETWIGGGRLASVAFDDPWGRTRGCVTVTNGELAIVPRDRLPKRPPGDLLQAGPILVDEDGPLALDGGDPEGFSSGRGQFDSDITVGRYPRAALGIGRDAVLAVACDGRSPHDAGLTLAELAELMIALGAVSAINLDGGGSTSLVAGGRLLNRPREEHGIEFAAGRPVSTALVFSRG